MVVAVRRRIWSPVLCDSSVSREDRTAIRNSILPATCLSPPLHRTAVRASYLPVPGQGRNLRRMLNWAQCSAVERVPGKVSGAWVFKGSRVPVQALFENLEGGATVDQFLEWFPGVTREQALSVLKFAESSLAVAVG